MDLRLIINGKKAADEQLRDAIGQFRTRQPLAVRVTYEGGDIERFINEAVTEGVKRVVVAGGDGTVNEAVNALMKLEKSQRLELAILPMGTANDFATAANIPHGYLPALKLAAQGKSHAIDTVEVDKRYFVNVASAGFGAKITATTPPALKNLLGGGAYTLAGLVQALSFVPYSGELTLPDGERTSGDIIAAAVCNGRQAGGGQLLAPHAYINDGLVDLVAFTSFAISDVPAVIEELSNYPNSSQQWVKRFQVPWLEWQTQTEMPINLDGEPISSKQQRFEVHAGALNMVLPDACSMLR